MQPKARMEIQAEPCPGISACMVKSGFAAHAEASLRIQVICKGHGGRPLFSILGESHEFPMCKE